MTLAGAEYHGRSAPSFKPSDTVFLHWSPPAQPGPISSTAVLHCTFGCLRLYFLIMHWDSSSADYLSQISASLKTKTNRNTPKIYISCLFVTLLGYRIVVDPCEHQVFTDKKQE